MTRARLSAAVIALLAIALLLQWPLRLLPDVSHAGAVSAHEITGSVWRGSVRGATWQGVALGDVALRAAPRLWLSGRLGWHARTSTASGELVVAPVRGVRGFTGSVELPPLRSLRARLRMQDLELLFDDANCFAAGGQVSLELETVPASILQGTPRCAGAHAEVTLASTGAPVPGWPPGGMTVQLDGQGRIALHAAASPHAANALPQR